MLQRHQFSFVLHLQNFDSLGHLGSTRLRSEPQISSAEFDQEAHLNPPLLVYLFGVVPVPVLSVVLLLNQSFSVLHSQNPGSLGHLDPTRLQPGPQISFDEFDQVLHLNPLLLVCLLGVVFVPGLVVQQWQCQFSFEQPEFDCCSKRRFWSIHLLLQHQQSFVGSDQEGHLQ